MAPCWELIRDWFFSTDPRRNPTPLAIIVESNTFEHECPFLISVHHLEVLILVKPRQTSPLRTPAWRLQFLRTHTWMLLKNLTGV